jgi:gliding motility-associated-like protein
MQCKTIAVNGSDFLVTGSNGAVMVTSASGNCNDQGLTNTIVVKLSNPIQKAGNYRITLKTGIDGNTILNECGQETPAGSFLPFNGWDTVSADFQYKIKLGCKTDTIAFSHDGRNRVNKWLWTFENPLKSNAKDTAITYTIFNDKIASLIVSNGVCSDTSAILTIKLDNTLKAVFESTANVCPGDPALFKDNSFNNVTGWQWSFGNGETSNLKSPPPQLYPSSNSTRDLPIRLIVSNSIGCFDTIVNTIRVVGNCYIAVPKAFTPNADGLNDFLYPTNAYKARDLYFAVYNRAGQKLFETTDWTNKWNGNFKGNPQDPGTYVWVLNYTHIETGQRFNLKGTTVLIR